VIARNHRWFKRRSFGMKETVTRYTITTIIIVGFRNRAVGTVTRVREWGIRGKSGPFPARSNNALFSPHPPDWGTHSFLSSGYCVPLVLRGSPCSFYHNASICVIHCMYLPCNSFHGNVVHAQTFIF
jgi:hypothetical protein